MKRKPVKGELRRNKLHIPHPVRRKRRTGVVRSVVPPFPTRIASLDSRGSPVPFANPLKTTKKGAAAPFLGFSPEFGSYRGFFKLTKREADAYLRVRRGYRNTLRLFPLQLERQFVCVRCAMQPLQERRPFDFHTSNIQRAQTKRRARCIVRLGNPIRRPPEGRLDYGRRNDNTHNVTTSFFCATALFCVSSALFFHIFSRKREKIWPAERRHGASKSIAPSVHPNAEKSRPCGRLSIYLLSRASRLRGWRHRPSADAASLHPFPYGRRRSAYRRTGGPSSCAAAG